MSSVSATPAVSNLPSVLASVLASLVPRSVQLLGPSTPSLQETHDRLVASIDRSENAINEIESVEIIPVLFELLENIKLGKIAPKDFDNAVS